MIINSKQDIANLPEEDRAAWMETLAATIRCFDVNGDMQVDTSVIERFGFAVEDFPDAPIAPYIPPEEPKAEHPTILALRDAHENGIELPFGGGSVRLACNDYDRALFSSALTLYRTAEDLLPSAPAKAAFRDSEVSFADASGVTHALSITAARQLMVAYGSTYQAIWAAAAASRLQGLDEDAAQAILSS